MKYIGYLVYFISPFLMALDLSEKIDLPGSDIGQGDESLKRFLEGMVSVLQDITAITSVIGICIVGVMLIMSEGNEEKTESAKKYMVFIITGIILSVAAWSIISLIDLLPNSLNF